MIGNPFDSLLDDLANPNSPRNRDRVATGLAALDDLHPGFDRGHLVTVAARDLQVATDFTLGIVRRALRGGFPVYYANGDLSNRRARLGDVAGAPVFFDTVTDDPAGAFDRFAREVERYATANLRLAVIDPFTAFAPAHAARAKRTELLDEASRQLHRLAQRHKVTVIAAVALEGWDGGAGKLPLLRDLGVADGLTYDSDTVIVVHGAGERPGPVDIAVAKHRNGPAGVVAARYDPNCGRFTDVLTPGGA